MANKEFKDLDVKLHNFTRKQSDINRINKRVIEEMANYINNHWYKNRQQSKQVCMSAIK